MQLRRPSALAPLNLTTSSHQSESDSPTDPTLSDSGRFKLGDLQINAHGVVQTPSASGSSGSAGPAAALAAAGKALDFGELQGLEIIGRGASGFVRRAEHLPSGQVLAIKEITVSDETRRLQIFKEISTLLTSGDDPHLVHYHGARSYDGAIQIAMEYMDAGSLGDLLQAIGPVSEECIGAIAEQALLALAGLRERHLVHRDLKPQNILLNLRGQVRSSFCPPPPSAPLLATTSACSPSPSTSSSSSSSTSSSSSSSSSPLQVKVSDFGCVAELQDSFGKCGTFVGTVPYMSPERIHGEEYSYASDVWSFGLTIVECALGHFPYERFQGYWGILQAGLRYDAPPLTHPSPEPPPRAAAARPSPPPTPRLPPGGPQGGVSVAPRLRLFA